MISASRAAPRTSDIVRDGSVGARARSFVTSMRNSSSSRTQPWRLRPASCNCPTPRPCSPPCSGNPWRSGPPACRFCTCYPAEASNPSRSAQTRRIGDICLPVSPFDYPEASTTRPSDLSPRSGCTRHPVRRRDAPVSARRTLVRQPLCTLARSVQSVRNSCTYYPPVAHHPVHRTRSPQPETGNLARSVPILRIASIDRPAARRRRPRARSSAANPATSTQTPSVQSDRIDCTDRRLARRPRAGTLARSARARRNFCTRRSAPHRRRTGRTARRLATRPRRHRPTYPWRAHRENRARRRVDVRRRRVDDRSGRSRSIWTGTL